MTAEEVSRLYSDYRHGVNTPETRAANAQVVRNRRRVDRALDRVYGKIGRTTTADLQAITKGLVSVYFDAEMSSIDDDSGADDRIVDDLDVLRRLCAAREGLSAAIDDYIGRCLTAGRKPYQVGRVLDRFEP